MIFSWNGKTIHYADEGTGRAVVLLHGLGGNSENWILQRRLLSETHRVLSIDLPGHGLSTGRTICFTEYPEAIGAMLDHARVERATLCGLSTGARTGLAFAVRYLDRVSGVVIVNAFLHLEPNDYAKRIALYNLLLEKDGERQWADQLLALMGVGEHPAIIRGFLRSLDHIDPLHIRRIFREQIQWDQRPDLKNVHCPVLVVRGAKDRFIPAYCFDEIRAGLSCSKLAVLDTGHLPYLEKPAEFNQAVAQFLHENRL